MTVHDGRVAGADDIFVVEDGELGLELAYGVDGVRWACEYEAGADLLVVNAAQPDADVVTAQRLLHLLVHLVVYRGYLDLLLVRHEQEGIALAQEAGFDLANDDRAHVLVLLRYGDHEGSVEFAIDHRHSVQVA